MDTKWLVFREPDAQADLRLFCFPYAGGNAHIYRGWQDDLSPDHVQVCAVEIPGRGRQRRRPPFATLEPLVDAVLDAIEPFLDRPFALFGHSMGGLIAFELARTLRRRGGPQPVHLFVSAADAPGGPRTRPSSIRSAAEVDVKKELRVLGGTPQVLLDNEELMELMLPVLRADFSIIETYEYRPEAPLVMPITVFGGISDQVVSQQSLRGWLEQSTGDSQLRLFPGDHFFLHSAEADLVRAVADGLAEAARPRVPSS